jgi:serine/threonine protein kinase/Tfp pilus assembly protein PilF
MQPQEWQRIKDVLSAALDRPAAERGRFLAEACDGDDNLRREVDSLLAAHEEPENLLEQHSLDLHARLNAAGATYVGRRFGPWRVIREIGRGGMGAVFLAERDDGAFQQQVALKIIRHGVAGGELERHFRRERQILASLNHPHIAKLIDGGVSDAGELFLAMEFIAGEPLVEHVEHRGLAVEERLRLFVKICRAVSFAHQRLIIHRDLKPSNILVAADGEPRLLDFGLAKLAEPLGAESAPGGPDQTETAFRAFTPAYAAPEQILGKAVTTASDVFSLGVILYELLTREKPFHFEGKGLDDIIKTVTTGEPSAPSRAVRSGGPETATRRRQLRGDLDNITLKALQKDPARRYQSVAELADDIERHFQHLPIAARPSTLSYRASRFYHRNRIAVAAAGLILLAVLAGLTVALGQYRNARRESAKADVVNGFLQRVLVTGNPGAGRKGYQTTITDIWKDAEARLDSGEMAHQPEVRAELRFVVGNGYVNQGNYVAGEKNLRRAIAEQTRLYGAGSTTVLKSEFALAALFFATAAYDSAEHLYGPKLDRLRAEYHKGTIEPDFIARSLSDYAVMQRARGNAVEAETLLRESLAITTEHPDPAQAGLTGQMLTLILIDRGKFDEAEGLQRAAVAAHRATVDDVTPEFCAALTLLGIILMEKGDLSGADANLREAEAMYRKLYDPNFIAIYDNLRLQAQVAYLAGRYAEAGQKIEQVLQNYRRNSNPKYISFATALTVQGLILSRLGKGAEAEQSLREALELREANLPPAHFMTALTRGALGECLTARKHFAEAEALLLQSYRSLAESQGPANPRTRLALQRLAVLYEQWGKPDAAGEYRRRLAAAKS